MTPTDALPRLTRATSVAALLVPLLCGGCGGGRRGDDHGGAATSDGLGTSAAGSAASNDSVQRGRPVNDTLPGRDSQVRQPAGIADTTRRP